MCDDDILEVKNLGKMYKLYQKANDKIRDAFGLNFWKKNYYKEFWALRDVNLQIKKGERVGLIGHNGAGKSTFLKMVIGNLEPTEGTIEIKGKIQALMELGTGFHPDFTGRENIRTSLAYNGLNRSQIRAREEDIIDFAELGDYIDQPVKTYSAGMYARLAFSTATAIEPEVLVIDEVLGAGDAYFSGKCIERMKNLTGNSETTVLFVSHDLASVQALCDRIIWIDRGRVRYDGDPLTAIKRYSDTVREQQENKLKIRDQKVQQKQAIILDKEEELYASLLFRFYSDQPYQAKIRKIQLFTGDELLTEIEVGMAMDNDNKDKSYIIDEKKLMCWHDSEKDEKGYFRSIDKNSGNYGHAPFQLGITKARKAESDFTLVVTGELIKGSHFNLELFDQNTGQYQLLKTLEDTAPLEVQQVKFGMEELFRLLPAKEKEQMQKSDQEAKEEEVPAVSEADVEYQDSSDCWITSAAVYDTEGKGKKVFPFEKQISGFSFEVEFSEEKTCFYFAFLIFTIRGDIVISQVQKVTSKGDRKYRIDIPIGDTRFGTGLYTASFGVYDELDVMDDSKPQSAIALIDRGLSFEIERPLEYGLSLGSVLPVLPIKVSAQNGGKCGCSSVV